MEFIYSNPGEQKIPGETVQPAAHLPLKDQPQQHKTKVAVIGSLAGSSIQGRLQNHGRKRVWSGFGGQFYQFEIKRLICGKAGRVRKQASYRYPLFVCRHGTWKKPGKSIVEVE
jgi:hypothetical protein